MNTLTYQMRTQTEKIKENKVENKSELSPSNSKLINSFDNSHNDDLLKKSPIKLKLFHNKEALISETNNNEKKHDNWDDDD